jgi:benzoate/toluate 1,2-dioxygenase alpha subunit
MKHIFEGNWIYLAHESQIPNNNDYYTTHIGRQPIVIARKPGRAERLHQRLQPSRRHAVPAQARQQGHYTCPFHGWTFNNSGKLLKVKDPNRPAIRNASTRKAPTT